jgi:hypothetical protein
VNPRTASLFSSVTITFVYLLSQYSSRVRIYLKPKHSLIYSEPSIVSGTSVVSTSEVHLHLVPMESDVSGRDLLGCVGG